MTEQAVLPTLDQPPAQYTASLPAERILTALFAAGHRFGCWVLHHPTDPDWADGGEYHYATEAAAVDARQTFLDPIEPDQKPPGLVITHRFRPCFTLACVACGIDLGDEDEGVSALHYSTLTSLENEACYQCWSTDGQDWACPACPVLIGAAADGQVLL
jgi:hypothetical protein